MIDEKKLIDELKRMINSDEVAGYSPAAVIYSVCEKIWEQPKVGEWIPVADGLPEKRGFYWVTIQTNHNRLVMHAFFDQEWGLAYPEHVVAWRPAEPEPEPYQGEEENHG